MNSAFKFEPVGPQEEESLTIRLTRFQMESLQKGINKLLSATLDKKESITISFEDSKDFIILELL